jgi:uncharacterized protein (DUF697 family)
VSKGGAKLGPMTAVGLLREFRRGAGDPRPIAVAGAKELVPLLVRGLREGGESSAVFEGVPSDAAALVWVGPADESELRRASRAGIPIVAVTNEENVPYVLATDLVPVPTGQGFPLDEIAAALARKLGDGGSLLAARLPVLRDAICDHMIQTCARKNALIAAAVFIPGVDMPVLTLNQIRLVLRLAVAHGKEIDGTRALELAAVGGAGFAFRAVARELLDVVPIAGWAVKAGVSYAGTVAVGEAAVRSFELRD